MKKSQEMITDLVKQIAEQILKLADVKAVVNVYEDENKVIRIDIDTVETGLLIGSHGETLNSLQLVTSLIVYRKLGQWCKIVVDVGDYRKKREQSIKSMALRVADEVSLTKKPFKMNYLVPFERRIVHLVLKEHPAVITYSEGEGMERRLIIKPKQ